MIRKNIGKSLNLLCVVSLLALTNAGHAEPVAVTTRSLTEVLIFPVREAPATAVSLNDSHVSAEIRGVLKRIAVRVGDSVSAGDVIAEIECEDYEIALDQAQATYDSEVAKHEFARSQLGNARSLAKTKNISSEELRRRRSNALAARADSERSRAALRAAERSTEKCTIRAPLKAVVIERVANIGDYLVEGTKVVRLLDQENIEISAQVQEQDIASLRQAREAEFVTRDERYPVQLRTVLPMLESRLRSFEVRLEFTGEKATPGSSGRLMWKVPKPHVPTDYLVRKKNQIGMFLVVDGKASFRVIDGALDGLPAALKQVVEGQVAADGRFNLEDGAEVRIVEQRPDVQ